MSSIPVRILEGLCLIGLGAGLHKIYTKKEEITEYSKMLDAYINENCVGCKSVEQYLCFSEISTGLEPLFCMSVDKKWKEEYKKRGVDMDKSVIGDRFLEELVDSMNNYMREVETYCYDWNEYKSAHEMYELMESILEERGIEYKGYLDER